MFVTTEHKSKVVVKMIFFQANKNEEPQGPVPDQSGPADVEAENEEASPLSENIPSKGHSLIVKSRNSKNRVSLVIKPIGSSTEESSNEETPMNEDHVQSSSEEPPKPAENNESSSSRPMEHGSVQRENDLLSKLVDDTITGKPNEKGGSNSMYLTEDEINRLPIDLGNPKPPANDTGHATMNPDLPMTTPSLPHDIESLMTSVLGPSNTGSQRQEQEIQKIKNSLAADFELEKQAQKAVYGAKPTTWPQQQQVGHKQ